MTTPLPTLAATSVPSFRPDGTCLDLARPDPCEISFHTMAAVLSKIARFNGINHGPPWSVALHCVRGADAIERETGDPLLAALFLLHDGEEHLLGDHPTPAARVHAAYASVLTAERAARWPADDAPDDRRGAVAPSPEGRKGKCPSEHLRGPAGAKGEARQREAENITREAWNGIKAAWRAACWQAARLPMPSPEQERLISWFDRRMCDAEMLALFGENARPRLLEPDAAPLKLKGGIKPLAPMKAEEQFLAAFDRLIGADRRIEQEAIHAAHVALCADVSRAASQPPAAGAPTGRATPPDARSRLRPSTGRQTETHSTKGDRS